MALELPHLTCLPLLYSRLLLFHSRSESLALFCPGVLKPCSEWDPHTCRLAGCQESLKRQEQTQSKLQYNQSAFTAGAFLLVKLKVLLLYL